MHKAPLPGDIELLEVWGDFSPAAFIPDNRPNVVSWSADSSNVQVEKPIERNALLEQLKSWAKNWGPAAEPSQLLDSIDDHSLGLIGLEPKDLTPCETAVLRFLLQAGYRLTRGKIHYEMNMDNDPPGKSTIFNALSKLTGMGLLDNRSGSKPRGYQLTEQGRLLAERLD